MTKPNPLHPVPENVSTQAKAILGQPVDLSYRERATPASNSEWAEQIEESNRSGALTYPPRDVRSLSPSLRLVPFQ